MNNSKIFITSENIHTVKYKSILSEYAKKILKKYNIDLSANKDGAYCIYLEQLCKAVVVKNSSDSINSKFISEIVEKVQQGFKNNEDIDILTYVEEFRFIVDARQANISNLNRLLYNTVGNKSYLSSLKTTRLDQININYDELINIKEDNSKSNEDKLYNIAEQLQKDLGLENYDILFNIKKSNENFIFNPENFCLKLKEANLKDPKEFAEFVAYTAHELEHARQFIHMGHFLQKNKEIPKNTNGNFAFNKIIQLFKWTQNTQNLSDAYNKYEAFLVYDYFSNITEKAPTFTQYLKSAIEQGAHLVEDKVRKQMYAKLNIKIDYSQDSEALQKAFDIAIIKSDYGNAPSKDLKSCNSTNKYISKIKIRRSSDPIMYYTLNKQFFRNNISACDQQYSYKMMSLILLPDKNGIDYNIFQITDKQAQKIHRKE